MFISLITLIACRAEMPESIDDTIVGHDSETDSGIDDTDETGGLSLTVDFTTAWSAAVPFNGTTGEQVNLGALLITSNTEETVTVDTIVVSLWFDENNDGSYQLGKENGIEAGNFVSGCVLTDVVTYAVYAGPINANNDGRLVFVDDFTVGGPTSTALNVRCTLVDSAPFGRTYGVAVDINHASQEVIASVGGGASLIPVTLGSTNGVQNGLTLIPDVAVLVNYDYCSTSERRLHDIDGDGYGDPDNYEFVNVCEPWEEGLVNWIDGRDDCDDTRSDVNPGAPEVCDYEHVDENCDGNDNGHSELDWEWIYEDADRDGYGNHSSVSETCDGTVPPPLDPAEWVFNDDDCDDTDASVYPGNGC